MAYKKTAHKRRRVHSSKRRKNVKSRKNGGRRKIIMRGGIKIDDPSVKLYHGKFTDENEIIDDKGQMEYTNGDVYDGNWKDGVKKGLGIMRYANGDVYVGNWNDDKKNGMGTLKYANGDVYVGNWNDDKKNGMGKLEYATQNDTFIQAHWENDMPTKKVHTKYLSNPPDITTLTEYTGTMKDGHPHGKGELITNNQIYTGDFYKAKAHGKGSLYDKRLNIVYVGDFKEGKWHGTGCIAPFKYEPDQLGTYLISECGTWENHKKNGNFRKVNIEVNRDNTRSEVTYELNYSHGNVTGPIVEISRIFKPDI